MDLPELLSRPIAHRGLHRRDGAPENSLPAVEAAIRAGMGIEVDVQLSADGHAVLHHDTTLARVCGVNAKVRDVPTPTLLRMPLCRTDATVPLARDVIDLVAGQTPLFLDLKVAPRRRERRALAAQIARLTAGYDGPVAVVGFDPLAIAAAASAAPWVMRGQSGGVSLGPRTKYWATPVTRPLDHLWFAPISQPHFVSYNVDRLPHGAVDRLRDRMPVVGWTVKCSHLLRQMQPTLDQVIVEGPAAQTRECEQPDAEHYAFACAAA